jgi:DNA repair protein RecO (recombination protein O)
MTPGKYRFRAFVLTRTNYGDDDLIVNFFTREQGKLGGLAKHGRKSRKRFGNVLLSPALIELGFTSSRGRDLVRLDDGDLVRAFDGLGRDIQLLSRAGQALEMVDAFCAPLDPAPAVFELLLWTLDRLDRAVRPTETSLVFQLKMLSIAGFGPNLGACPLCGRPPADGRSMELRPDRGGLVCGDCAPGGFTISLGALKAMTLVQQLAVEKLDRVRLGESVQKQAGPFLLAFVRHTLGRDLKSFRFQDQLEQAARRP